MTAQREGSPGDEAPLHWTLPTGEFATLRAIRPDDLAIETDFVAGLSQETSYNRLFSFRKPAADELWRWTHVDPAREVALIVTVARAGAETMLGVARWVRLADSDTAEFAIVIGDASKRLGLGLALMTGLIAAARRHGLLELFGATFHSNVAMQALGTRLGFARRTEPGDATLMRMTLRLEDAKVRSSS